MLLDREKQIKQKIEEKDENKIQSVIADTNKVALKAIQKEMNLEQMIKQEEEDKESREEKEIMFQIDQEKRKSECLALAIKERTIENQYNLRASEADEEVKKIKDETANQITVRRNQLNEGLKKLKQNSARKKMKLKQKLQNVRFEMAKEMGKAYKKGDASRCEKAMNSESDRKTYCSVAYVEDYSSYSTCIEGGEEFCQMCCETEFGDFYVNDRQSCLKKFCKNYSDKTQGTANSSAPTQQANSNVSTQPANGRWLWQEALQPQH
jgi:hypothetical protein